MSTTKFGDVDKQVAKKKAAKEIEVVQETETKTELASYNASSGGPSSEDINIDHLQILGKSSQFDPEGGQLGVICINKETPLVHVDESIRGVLVHTRKYWKENVPYEDETTPRFANTVEEKAQIEKTTEFDGTIPVCDVTLLIERPESFTDDAAASNLFLYDFGGKEYALVKYTVQKSQAVRENYGTINVNVRARESKGEDASKYYFELRSKEKGTGTKFKWHQFVLSGSSNLAPEEATDFAVSLRAQ
jgi:hypothetical protein